MVERKQILVVDDSKLARMALLAVLADIGTDADMREAADAEAALAMLDVGAFDIVFMDYNMPGVDGLSAATVFRARCPDAAIALVTANAQDGILAEAERLRVRFIPKPVRRQDVALFLQGS
ncbi:MAG TPA: response regulator [Azospirillum sp.]